MDGQPASILRFYTKLGYQNHRRAWCNGALNNWQLIASATTLLPFQLRRIHRTNAINSVHLKELTGVIAVNLTSAYTFASNHVGDYDYLIPTIGTMPSLTAHVGKDLYLEITDGVETWYSEVFRLTADADIQPDGSEKCGHVKLSFSSGCIVGGIYKDFVQHLYIPGDILRPEYEIKEEGEEDGEGVFHPIFERAQKVYTIQFAAPEYIADALSLLSIVENVNVLDQWQFGGGVIEPTVDVKWETDCLAIITIKFKIDFAKRKGCCDDEEVSSLDDSGCLIANVSAKAKLAIGGAEYAGGYYVLNGSNVYFQEGEYAIVEGAGPSWDLRRRTGGAWVVETSGVAKDNCYVQREDTWFFKRHTGNNWANAPYISVITPAVGHPPCGGFNFKGYSFRGSSVKITGVNITAGCQAQQLSALFSDDYFFNTGIYVADCVERVQACAFTAQCSLGCGAISLDTVSC